MDGEQAPDANEEYLIYQILLGTWPVASAPGEGGAPAVRSSFASLTPAEHATYVGRIQEYMTKAIKEAKVNSSWIQPNEGWDEATRKFIAALLKRGRAANPFVKTFAPLAERIARLGMVNSLAQTVLKLTVPGVPDIYQGCELWDYSLVDPDNRRPVDYARHRETLAALEGADPRTLLASWPDGRVKLFVVRSLLHYRREHPALFAAGSYRALTVTGKHADSVVAFVREHGGASLLVVVPRLSARVGNLPVGEAWGNTALALEDGGTAAPWRDLFTGRAVNLDLAGSVPVSETLADFPCAVLARADVLGY